MHAVVAMSRELPTYSNRFTKHINCSAAASMPRGSVHDIKKRQASAAVGAVLVCSAIHAWAWILFANHGDHLLVPSARVISTMNLPALRKIL